MKNDITRDTFNPLKHFSRVLMQQGRVQLDADWNEQVSILLHYLRTVTADLVGAAAGPAAAWGFELIDTDADINALVLSDADKKALRDRLKKEHILIAPGRYYVDGLVVENERFVPFFDQPGWAVPKEDKDDIEKGLIKALVYLDVWEEHITPIEDDSIREKALGGPDTATRARITWAVRARGLTPDEAGKLPVVIPPGGLTTVQLEGLTGEFAVSVESETSKRGLLKAEIAEHEASDDVCDPTPESAYRGVENQLYRVEVHRGGPASDGNNKPATFKWSRDNGSVVASWLDTDGDVLRVSAPRDQARGFARSQWVELHDDHREMEGRRGTLVQLKDVEAGWLTIDPATASGSVDRLQFKINPKVRRWDQAESETITLDKGAVPIVEGQWITLEDGVQIQFQKPAGATPGELHLYRTGDYWLIPARVATRGVEWPRDKDGAVALPPHGVTHHYALLGLLAAATGTFTFTDCRRKFAPMALVV